MWKRARLALVAVSGIAAVILTQFSVAGANVEVSNPAAVSCIVSPGDPDINEIITFDFNGFDGTVVFRQNTGPGTSKYLFTLSPTSEVSASITPLGYFIRYRIGTDVFDIPCSPSTSPNPAGVACTATGDAGVDGTITVELNDFEGPAFLRENTGPGTSKYLATLSPNSEVSTSISPLGYFIRYRIGTDVFDIPCETLDGPNPTGITCEYFSIGNDEISLIVSGAPDDLPIFVRALTADGSRYVTRYTPNAGATVADNAEYIARYREAGVIVDVPCLQLP